MKRNPLDNHLRGKLIDFFRGLLRSRPSGCHATLFGEPCVTSRGTAATSFYWTVIYAEDCVIYPLNNWNHFNHRQRVRVHKVKQTEAKVSSSRWLLLWWFIKMKVLNLKWKVWSAQYSWFDSFYKVLRIILVDFTLRSIVPKRNLLNIPKRNQMKQLHTRSPHGTLS